MKNDKIFLEIQMRKTHATANYQIWPWNHKLCKPCHLLKMRQTTQSWILKAISSETSIGLNNSIRLLHEIMSIAENLTW